MTQVDYWVPHEQALWLPGKLRPEDGSSLRIYQTAKGDLEFPADKKFLPIHDENALEGVADVCTLNDISDASLLHSLRVRYARDEIYTYVSCVLIAINPFKPINNYSSEYIEMYHSTPDYTHLPPHIYGIAHNAFQKLTDQHLSQAVLISGESGAGKTENTKFLLLYLSEILKSDMGLQDKLLEVNPILESFGNAKTVRNDNSSRFGKWIEVNINPATMSLADASVTDYLLEVTRVCSQGPGERNYHVFHQLLSATAQSTFPMLKLDNAADFAYLKRNAATIQNRDDSTDFMQLRRALTAMKFTSEEEESIFRIAAGILHIGNIDFVSQRVDEAGVHAEGCVVQDESALQSTSEIMQWDAEMLSKCVRFKRRETGWEVFMSPLDSQQACAARDSIAKLIYGRLFKWLVTRCNLALGQELKDTEQGGPREKRAELFFGVLDIAGFEFFETNMLEQLFINFVNEKLQNFFNNVVFKAELAEYMSEGVPVEKINYIDNSDVLQLLEGQGGLLVMLDDAVMGVRQTDLQYTTKIIQSHEKHKKFLKPKFVKDAPLQFGIRHYAGDVMYTTECFLEKNISTSPPEVLELMANSKNTLLQSLAEELQGPKQYTSSAKSTVKKPTVGAMFRKSLAQLLVKLESSEANFVRCIKPNARKLPAQFDAPSIMDQLRLSGVLETVKIRKAGFLMRPKHLDFFHRYHCLLEKKEKADLLKAAGSTSSAYPDKGTNMEKAINSLLGILPNYIGGPIDPKEIALGKTKVFIKSELYTRFEKSRRKVFGPIALTVQSIWRGYRTRVIMKEVMEVNDALKRCTAQAGVSEHREVVALRENVHRASEMENSLVSMNIWLDRAMKLYIKLPSLPLYLKAQAHLAAQSKVARSLQNSLTSLDVPEMQAHVARATSYNMRGPLVDSLNKRIDKVLKQLRFRRLLQNVVSCDVVAEAEAIMKRAREEEGLHVPENWLLPDGPACWAAAQDRLEELQEENKERAGKIASVQEQLDGLQASVELPAMQAVLAQSMAYDLELPEVKRLRERADKLKEQAPHREALRKCAGSYELDAIAAVLQSVQGAGLDDPEVWLWPDGAKLYARVVRWQLELQQGKAGEDNAWSAIKRRVAVAAAASSQEVSGDQAAAVKVYSQCRLQSFQHMLDVPSMKLVLGDEIAHELKERCDLIKKELSQLRSLQICSTHSNLDDIAKELEAAGEKGFGKPEAWTLPEGRALLEMTMRQCESLKEERQATARTVSELEEEMEKLMSSFDVLEIKAFIARAVSHKVNAERLDELRVRWSTLQKHNEITAALLTCPSCPDTEAVSKVLTRVTEAGLDHPDGWLAPEGHKDYLAAAGRLESLQSWTARMARAVEEFDAAALHAALAEAAALHIPEEQFAEEHQLLVNLQDSTFVEKKIMELLDSVVDEFSPEDSVRLSNLLELVNDPDHFDTCKIMEELSFSGALEALKMREAGFLMRPSCEDFVNRYIVVLPLGEQEKIQGKDASSAKALLKSLPEFLTGATVKEVDAVVGKAKVFLKGDVYRVLEGARRRALRDPAVVIQAFWRGRKARQAVEEVAAVDCSVEACLEKVTDVHTSLATLDKLLDKAARLRPRPAPRLEAYVRARMGLATRAYLEKAVREQMENLDVAAMQSVIAIADANKDNESAALAVAPLRARCQALKEQLVQQRELRSCLAYSNVEDVQSVVGAAADLGLDEDEAWLLPAGPSVLGAAKNHLEELKEAEQQRNLAVKGIEEQLKSLTSSLDVQAIKTQLAHAMAYEMKGDLVNTLRSRCEKIQLHSKLRLALLGCRASGKSNEDLEQAISEAASAGLSSPDEWLLSDGAQFYTDAVEQLEQSTAVKARISAAAASLDAGELQSAFREADGLGIPQESYAQEYQLFLSLKENSFVERKVLELCEAGNDSPEEQLKITNLLDLVEDVDGLDSCKLMKQPCLSACMDNLRIQKGGLVMRPSCQLFVQKYLGTLPKSERAGILAESDPVKAVRTLVRQMPDVPAHLKSSGIAVGRRKVFLTAEAYRQLEAARLRACRAPSTKIQAAWRGRCTRRLVRDVAAVDRDISSCIADASLDEPARLAKLDEQLARAVKLSMRLPRMPMHVKARAQVAARANVAEQLKEQGTSNDALASQVLHARANLHGVGGPAVDELQGSCEVLAEHLRLRRKLRCCTGAPVVSEVEPILEEARKAGLHQGESWRLPDGPDAWSAAEQRGKLLKDECERRSQFIAGLKKQLAEQMTCTEAASIDALLAETAGLEELADYEKNEELATRSAQLKAQLPHMEALKRCLNSSELLEVSAALQEAENFVGPGDSWLYPEAPRLVARVRGWFQQLQERASVDECFSENVKQRLQEMSCSFDGPTITSLVEQASEYCAGSQEAMDALRARHAALEQQSSLCQKIATCPAEAKPVSEILAAVTEANLDSANRQSWLLPHGPRQVCKLKAWQELLSGPAGQEQAEEIARRLEERTQEAKEEVDVAKVDLESHMWSLDTDLEAPEMQVMLGEQLASAMKTRCKTLKAQLVHRRSLQVCTAYVSLEDVRTPHANVCEAGLDNQATWVLADGPRLYDMATTHLHHLEEEAQVAEAARGEVEREMQELNDANSVDIPAMRALISKGENCNVKEELIEVLRERCGRIEAQLPLRKALQSCAFCEELQEVQRIIGQTRDAGLTTPEKWLLPDGPKLFARAIARVDTLQEVEDVKAQIASASTKLDAKGLHAGFARAGELGLPQTLFAEAHELFLRLQDGAWVEQKSEELRRCQEPAYRLMVSNLAEQLEVLGLKVDSAGMREVTAGIMADQKKRKSRKKSSLFNQGGALQRELVTKCFSDLKNFSRLRNPLSWGAAHAHEEPNVTNPDGYISKGEEMLKYSPEFITQSLTVLDEELEQAALTNFHDLLRHMGDKPAVAIMDSEEPIIKHARRGDPLRDEVYMQILKQLTDNPGTESVTNGYEILTRLFRDELLPSEELCDFVRGYLQVAAQRPDEEEDDSDLCQGRRRGISFSAETEIRTRNRATTWGDFTRTRRPQLAQDALDMFLSVWGGES